MIFACSTRAVEFSFITVVEVACSHTVILSRVHAQSLVNWDETFCACFLPQQASLIGMGHSLFFLYTREALETVESIINGVALQGVHPQHVLALERDVQVLLWVYILLSVAL